VKIRLDREVTVVNSAEAEFESVVFSVEVEDLREELRRTLGDVPPLFVGAVVPLPSSHGSGECEHWAEYHILNM